MLEDVQEAAEVVLGLDGLVADGPQVRAEQVDLDVRELGLQDRDVLDYLAEDEV